MPDSILVTGGAGFIGSHLCEALLDAGHGVICVDNFCDFYAPSLKQANLESCQKHPDFVLYKDDIRDYEAMRRIFCDHKIDAVCHLAAMAGVRPSIQNPELYFDVNVSGTLLLLDICRAHRVNKFIFASSSSVYGNSAKLPSAEDDFVDHPISPYAASKKAGELLCHTWHHLYGITVLCLRFFTVFGPRQRPDLAIHKFAALIKSGLPLPVYGDGSSSRDYTYIKDTVAGIIQALDYAGINACYEVVNLGNDQSVSLSGMIDSLEKVSGTIALKHSLPFQEGDVRHTRADISKAARLFGYRPRTSFEEGVREFWDWFDG